MALNRVVELDVALGSDGVRISDLDVSFRVERSITVGQQSAAFRVYNAQETTRKETIRKDRNVIFRAGYEDEGVGGIFVGSITRVVSMKKEGDWITDIQAQALRGEETALTQVTLSLSYGPGTRMRQIIRTFATATGLALFGDSLADFALPNGFVFVGTAQRAIEYIRYTLEARGLALYIDNAELIVFREGEGLSGRFGSLLLSYESGLLEVEDLTEGNEDRRRIRYRTIMIPTLQPNGLVTIDTPGLSGTFVNEKVTFSGDNFGGDFGVEGEATE